MGQSTNAFYWVIALRTTRRQKPIYMHGCGRTIELSYNVYTIEEFMLLFSIEDGLRIA